MNISVIIPVYNTEQYLEECLDSLLLQQFQDWECLLIDDGSTDGSGNICDRYAQKDSRFRVFHTINSGVSAARNLGIEHASAPYIAFIDSDDTVDSTYLSQLYEAIIEQKTELVVCGIKLIRQSGTEINCVNKGLITIGNKDADRFTELNEKHLLYGPVIKLYRSDIIKEKEIRFPIGIQYGEDLIFNLEYLEYVTTISTIDSSGYNYRIILEGSLSSSAQRLDFKMNYEQWKIICSFFERKKIDGINTQIYLSNRLWGIAYDLVMNNRLSVNEIKYTLCCDVIHSLKTFDKYTICIPKWLKIVLLKRFYGLMWLIQRRVK
ncbi:glycosyltransferase family 2 protein [Prevotella sp. 10(H)]|uniref:glycosyltransferase family 2 protein n=1 Tax=Prevotella sp. 10(H) TaxID=1158294 RepID=UPI00068BAFC3|nr:glycosyltransferase family 2 protein [Prevotella sp. 10(H)]